MVKSDKELEQSIGYRYKLIRKRPKNKGAKNNFPRRKDGCSPEEISKGLVSIFRCEKFRTPQRCRPPTEGLLKFHEDGRMPTCPCGSGHRFFSTTFAWSSFFRHALASSSLFQAS
jgi:hypothetical protein